MLSEFSLILIFMVLFWSNASVLLMMRFFLRTVVHPPSIPWTQTSWDDSHNCSVATDGYKHFKSDRQRRKEWW